MKWKRIISATKYFLCVLATASLSPVHQPYSTIQQVLETGDGHVLTHTAALMTSPCPVHEHKRPLLLIGWSSVVWLAVSHCVYMLIYRASAVYEHQIFFSTYRELTASEQRYLLTLTKSVLDLNL